MWLPMITGRRNLRNYQEMFTTLKTQTSILFSCKWDIQYFRLDKYFLKHFIFYLWVYACVWGIQVPLDVRRGHRIPCFWSYRSLWAWLLEAKLWSSARAVGLLTTEPSLSHLSSHGCWWKPLVTVFVKQTNWESLKFELNKTNSLLW